jgi:ABC-type bacteriocin/lantibiotic exporter with double-glycine peptidase domain
MRLLSQSRWAYWPALAPAIDRAQPLPDGLYQFIWRLTSRDQALLSALTLLVIPLSALPLELQRRMMNEAIGQQNARLLIVLAVMWIVVLLVQGGLKYLINLRRGLVVEKVARELRRRVHRVALHGAGSQATSEHTNAGLLVSMVAAEAENVAGFVAESISVPLLQAGTIVAVLGYLIWVQPLIAALSLLLYLPELIIVPWQQRTINRLGRLHTLVVRRLGILLVREEMAVPGGVLAKMSEALVERAFRARLASYRIKYGLTFLGNLLDALGPLAVLGFGGWLVTQGQTSVGALLVFITGFQKVGDPLDQLMTFYRTTQNAVVTYGLIVGTLTDSSEPQGDAATASP